MLQNMLFIILSDLNPRTIDLNLYVNLPIEMLYIPNMLHS